MIDFWQKEAKAKDDSPRPGVQEGNKFQLQSSLKSFLKGEIFLKMSSLDILG